MPEREARAMPEKPESADNAKASRTKTSEVASSNLPLTDPAKDFPRWYQDLVAKAELAENGPVRGTMVVRPWGYAIWERIQADLDQRIKALGVDNAYFPSLLPERYLRLEAEHVEGFSPELAVVTHAGGKDLEERVVIRPTSETVINAYFAKWIQSHRDLPMKVNQWVNVVRWELRPRLFLRTTEFLWQEGHTAHATKEEARDFALEVLREVYVDFMQEVLGIEVLAGRKTDSERFAGAVTTWTCEGMMGDGKALQMGTSHELGQNFAKAFGITFLDQDGQESLVWQTSWGVSTRLMGALVMAHGDRSGLRLPPSVAPIQAVVLIARDGPGVAEAAKSLANDLASSGIRARLDDRLGTSFGRRAVDWEIKGVPVRVEIGPRDLQSGQVVLARRDTGTKDSVSIQSAVTEVARILQETTSNLHRESIERLRSNTFEVSSLSEAIEASESGFASFPARLLRPEPGPHGETSSGERELNESGVTVRCLIRPDGSLPAPGDGLEDLTAIAARAY
jgi:prolyl-tRNA synthetase